MASVREGVRGRDLRPHPARRRAAAAREERGDQRRRTGTRAASTSRRAVRVTRKSTTRIRASFTASWKTAATPDWKNSSIASTSPVTRVVSDPDRVAVEEGEPHALDAPEDVLPEAHADLAAGPDRQDHAGCRKRLPATRIPRNTPP